MTPTQFRDAIDTLELSQLAVGRILGHDGRTVRKWVSGEVRVPPTVAILLRLMVSGKLTPNEVHGALGKRDARPRSETDN